MPEADSRDALSEFKEEVDLPDSWTVETDRRTLEFDYEAVPISRLQRSSRPGVDVNNIRGMWMLASHDRIARGFNRDHQGILARGKSIDCQHFDDAVAALEHAMERVEKSVGEELRDGHAEPKLLTDGGEAQPRDETERGLYAKYDVRTDGEPVEDCFVLEPEDDSAAREALLRYAEETDDEALAEDLREWVAENCTRGTNA